MGSWGEQFSTGDQSKSSRIEFSDGGYKRCVECHKENMKEDRHCAGCRHNGDGYGTMVYTCNSCGWSTSFQYDEAGDSYFYETKYLNAAPIAPQETSMTPEKEATFIQLMKLAPVEAVRQTMRRAGFFESTIENFVAQHPKT